MFYALPGDLRLSPHSLIFCHHSSSCGSSYYPLPSLSPPLIFLHLLPHHFIPPSSDAKHRAESELGPHTRPRSNTLPKSFGSTLDQGTYDAAGDVKGPHPTREETLELIQRRVKGKRQEDGWPDDIKVRSQFIYLFINRGLGLVENSSLKPCTLSSVLSYSAHDKHRWSCAGIVVFIYEVVFHKFSAQ